MKPASKLLTDLARLPQFSITLRDDANQYGLGRCRSFYIRWRQEGSGFIVEFGQKKTFDKWGNSTDFTVWLQYERGLYRDDVVPAHRWMERVCRCGLFDFNNYPGTIKCPRLGYFKNK